jgi:hypothetical protein
VKNDQFLISPPAQKVNTLGPRAADSADQVTRRRFLKRTGGVTVGALIALNLANTAHAMNQGQDGSSWSVQFDAVLPGDGANTEESGAKSKYGWNWKSALVTINSSSHLLALRWKCTPNPKHPVDLIDKRKLEWEFRIEVVAQVRSGPTSIPNPLPVGFESYMVYGGQFYEDVPADAGWSEKAQSGTNGTMELKVSLISETIEGNKVWKCRVLHSPIDDFEPFYDTATEQHNLIVAVRTNPVDNSRDIAPSCAITITASVIKEDNPSPQGSFGWEFTPPASLTLKTNVAPPPNTTTTTKLGEITTALALAFSAVNEGPTD